MSPFRRIRNWSDLESASIGRIYERSVATPRQIWMSVISDDSYKKSFAESDHLGMMAETVDGCNASDPLDRILFGDQKMYLSGDLLVKVDRMTMWHSLEGRSPLLDHHIVEFAASLSRSVKFPGFRAKHLLKALLLRDFPRKFVYRTKMGFGVPLAAWLRKELAPLFRDVVLASEGSDTNFLCKEKVRRLYKEHCSGTMNHSDLLWAILNFELWRKEHSA